MSAKKSQLELVKPEVKDLRLEAPGAILFGKKCSECGGFLLVPQRGPAPSTCSPACRVAKFRRLKKNPETSGS
jgi:rRNA maturation protein Nop10